ncbi:MAG TPA: hypothetical protein VLS93_14895 [Anaeromyxobacteraceae bacterium]|nr:hypothetical protein [Anaeromyxobacteraceae bacterium]
MPLLRALSRLLAGPHRSGPGGGRAGAPPVERRRPSSCAYHVDPLGDRLEGYDAGRRVAWVVWLER